ncbi:unnamed protein product, partial [Cuscuta europaea]
MTSVVKNCRRGALSSFTQLNPCKLFLCSIFVIIIFSSFAFSPSRLFFLGYHCPRLVTTWGDASTALAVVSGNSSDFSKVSIQETVITPDEALLFLKYPQLTRLFTRGELDCVYFSPAGYTTSPAPPKSVDDEHSGRQIIRCEVPPHGSSVSLAVKMEPHRNYLPAGPTYSWD